MSLPSVAHTAEFQRIASLPRRTWLAEELADLASQMTAILKTPRGTMTLKPQQALALHDAGVEGGLFAPLGVGEGKTLISFLLPVVIPCKRSLLNMPAGLIGERQSDRRELSKHWRIPNELRLFSYDMLGRVQAADELETYAPDLIIFDEAHRAKNLRAAVTRRLARYFVAHPYTKCCALSGSMMDRTIKEFAHLLRWCLKLKSPIPLTNEELEEWAQALDNDVEALERRDPGALLSLCTAEELANNPTHVAARLGFRRRLTETPGVVATVGEGESVGASIYVRAIQHKVAPVTEANFLKLREEWATPDDWLLMTGVDVWRHAQELALGLHYVWNPRPPDDWRNARREWHAFVRDTISRSRTYDSEKHVSDACDAGLLETPTLAVWRKFEPEFTPNVEVRWHDDSALKVCAEWMKKPGLVWTEHAFFAECLSQMTGAPYFGAAGFDAGGRYIQQCPPGISAIASIDANREGRNLQHLWSRCLFVTPPKSAAWNEQAIARFHRTGQKADEVIVDVLLGCRENYDAITAALAGAEAIEQTTGKRQKLIMADVLLPSESEIDALRSPRWTR